MKGLTGDASTDDATFSSLSDMFAGGIAQNQKNAKAVSHSSLLVSRTGISENSQI